jgi:hypothetical protein
MIVEHRVYMTRGDILRAGDFNAPLALDGYPGRWFVMQRPVADWWGRTGPVRAILADPVVVLP